MREIAWLAPLFADEERRLKAWDVVSPSHVMVTVSPPVSPSVVARILIAQKPSVTAGTLLSTASVRLCGGGGIQGRVSRQGSRITPKAWIVVCSELSGRYPYPVPVR